MEIKKEDFERAISLAYHRGRVTPIRCIEQDEINACIIDIYNFLGLAQQQDSADGDCREGGLCAHCEEYIGLGEWHECRR